MSGYNINVGDRMLPEIGKEAEKKRGVMQETPFFFAIINCAKKEIKWSFLKLNFKNKENSFHWEH